MMHMLDPKLLKQQTAQRLSAASYSPRRLALIHTGVSLVCSLVLTVISFLLSQQVAGTGGLSGLGTRAVLQSVQSVLSMVLSLAMPFWGFGFVAAVLGLARKQRVEPRDLTAGFRKVGPIARLLLLQAALYGVMAFAAIQASTIAVMMTPAGNGLAEIMERLSRDTEFMQYGVLPEEMMEPLLKAATPVYAGAAVLFVGLAIPVTYRVRLAPYIVMEEGNNRAFRALLQSNRLMRGHGFAFFKLDISFWWYWLLQVLCSVLAYGDVWLPMVGVELPFDADVALFVFCGVQILGASVLAWCWRAPVETTYAVAYNALAGEPKKDS